MPEPQKDKRKPNAELGTNLTLMWMTMMVMVKMTMVVMVKMGRKNAQLHAEFNLDL